jgi:hypothetical protein
MDNDRHEASTGSTRINTIVLAFTVVTGLLVTMRLFGRLIPTRIPGVEDIWIVVALVGSMTPRIMISDHC